MEICDENQGNDQPYLNKPIIKSLETVREIWILM